MIDFHCHLDLYPSPSKVIAEADKRGVYIVAMTNTPKAFEGNLLLAEGRKRIRVAVGLHPELVSKRYLEVDEVAKHMARTKYVGEIGIDGSPEHAESLGLQKDVFSTLLSAAENLGGKILSIHSRRADTAVLTALEKHRQKSVPVLHWFSGSQKSLAQAISLGCWFSVGPAMLRTRNGRELAARMPRERVLLETDGPFGTNQYGALMPWDAIKALSVMAELWGASVQDAEKLILGNLRHISSMPTEPISENRTVTEARI